MTSYTQKYIFYLHVQYYFIVKSISRHLCVFSDNKLTNTLDLHSHHMLCKYIIKQKVNNSPKTKKALDN